MERAYADLIDRALADKPPEVRARVLDVVRKLGIDAQDEFWLLFIALGQMQVYIEDVPDTLAAFQENLDRWSETNLQVLEAVAEKSEIVQTLASNSKELGDILTTLVKTCNLLVQQLQASSLSSPSSAKAQEHSIAALNISLTELKGLIRKQQGHLDSTLLRMEQRLSQTNRIQRGLVSKWPWAITLAALTALGWFQYQHHLAIEQVNERSQWELENVIRIACATGAKPQEAEECQ